MAQSGLLNKACKAAVLKRFGHVHCHSARLTLINNLCNRHGDVYPTEEGYSGEYEKKDGHGGGLRSRLRGAEVASVTQYSTGECLFCRMGIPFLALLMRARASMSQLCTQLLHAPLQSAGGFLKNYAAVRTMRSRRATVSLASPPAAPHYRWQNSQNDRYRNIR